MRVQHRSALGLGWLLVVFAIGPLWAAPGEEQAESAGPIFVEVPPVSVPLVRGTYLHGRVYVRLNLGVESEKAQSAVEKRLPRLEAAYLSRMSALAQYQIDPDKAVDVPVVAKALQQTTDRVLEPGMAEVFIQEAGVRQ